MKVSEILKNLDYIEYIGDAEAEFGAVSVDSRRIREGDLFICCKGLEYDSHNFAEQAVLSGAKIIVCEVKLGLKINQIIVKDGRMAISQIARAYYDFPDKQIKIVGVTGTNGKTTTTYMLDSIFKADGKKTGIIGTLGIVYGEKFIDPELTTPDPLFLFNILSDMVKCGVEYVFMEVSAHALYFNRIDGLSFEVGIYTNCTQDHLDFFENMREYSNCKKSFFTSGKCKYVVLNSDDEYCRSLMGEIDNAICFGLRNPADVFAVDIDEKIWGTTFVINLFDELYDINLKIPALHNVYNAMGAATAAKLLGIKTESVAKGLSDLKGVNGRLEHVAKYNGADIFVDFAHTPDGLENSLKSLKKLCKGKLYCLFGCGGNRDRTKRPIMGKIAAEYADFVIITSDNPRYEDPFDIICEIEKGVVSSGKKYVTVTERESATEYAVNLLEKDDILLVAGKGGEYYQEIMGIKHSYNDNQVIKKIIG